MSEPERADPEHQRPGRQTAAGLRALSERPIFICLLLLLTTLAVYWPVGEDKFISYDDPLYITSNPHVQQGLTPASIRWAFSTGYAANWHPLSWLSHMLDVELFGPGPAGPHLVNLLLHTANTILLFLALRNLTSAHWRSAFAAALFALHPLHVESVAWVSERKDVLSTLFAFLTLWAYGRYAQKKSGGERGEPDANVPVRATIRRRGVPDYFLALLFFALSLMSKPMPVTLPFVLLLLDYWPLGRMPALLSPAAKPRSVKFQLSGIAPLVGEKIPFLALSVISCVITFWAQQKGEAVATLADYSLGTRIDNAFISYARYLGKMFWPADLAVLYPYPERWPMVEVILAIALVAGLSLAAIRFGQKWPFVFAGWFWFLGMLVPVIGLVQVGIQSLADRYTYVPSVGIFIVLAWGAGAIVTRWRRAWFIIWPTALLVLGACAIRTAIQLQYWQNTERLFQHTIAITRGNWVTYSVLGSYLEMKGHLAEAADNDRKALQINPDSANLWNNLGCVLIKQQQATAAMKCFQNALRLEPALPDTHINLGLAFEQLGKNEDATRQYREALRLAPTNTLARNDLANVLFAQGQVDEAIAQYRQTLRTDPKYAHALNNLAWALASQGQYPEAIAGYEQALRLEPDNIMFHRNFANVLARAGHLEAAAEQLTEVLRLAPDDADAHYALGCVLEQLGRRAEAIAQLKEALRLKPDDPEAKQQLEALGAAAR